MNLFQLCQEDRVTEHITPRNSHIRRRYKNTPQAIHSQPSFNLKKSLSNRKNNQNGLITCSKKSLKKKNIRNDKYLSVNKEYSEFQDSGMPLKKIQPSTPTRKYMNKVPYGSKELIHEENKKQMRCLESFYTYGSHLNSMGRDPKFCSGRTKTTVKFIYDCPPQAPIYHQPESSIINFKQYTDKSVCFIHSIYASSTKIEDEKTKIQDSRISNILQHEVALKNYGLGEFTLTGINKSKLFKFPEQYSHHQIDKLSATKSISNLDNFNCINTQSVFDQNQNLDDSELCSEILEDSYIMKLKKCQSADYFGYNEDIVKKNRKNMY